jgi:hypothetical protein
MKQRRFIASLFTLAFVFSTNFASPIAALDDPPPQRIRFAKGANSAIIKGTIKGYAFKDYVFAASAGQHAKLTLTSTNTYAAFVIHRTDADPDAELSIESTEWENTLQESGDYVIRVLMIRAGARRPGAMANYVLKLEIN